MIFQGGKIQFLTDLLQHLLVIRGIRICIVRKDLVVYILSLSFRDHSPGDQIHLGFGTGEIQIFTSIKQRRAGRTDMYFLRTVAVKKFCCLAKLCTADNRIVNHQKALVLNQFVHRDQFHSGDQVSLALLCWHERTRPGRCIFDKRTGKRYTGTVRITDRMGDSGIRDTGYNVRMHLSCISLGEHITTFITHFLYIDTFVGRSRISIVYPEEGTDTHLFSWFLKRFDSFRSHKNDLARSQRFLIFVSKINVCMALKRNTACILLASDDQRCTSQAVSGCDQSFRSQKQHRH